MTDKMRFAPLIRVSMESQDKGSEDGSCYPEKRTNDVREEGHVASDQNKCDKSKIGSNNQQQVQPETKSAVFPIIDSSRQDSRKGEEEQIPGLLV